MIQIKIVKDQQKKSLKENKSEGIDQDHLPHRNQKRI